MDVGATEALTARNNILQVALPQIQSHPEGLCASYTHTWCAILSCTEGSLCSPNPYKKGCSLIRVGSESETTIAYLEFQGLESRACGLGIWGLLGGSWDL